MAYVSTWSLTVVFGYAPQGSGGMLYCNQNPFPLHGGGVWAQDIVAFCVKLQHENIWKNVCQIEKSQFISLVWGSLTLAQKTQCLPPLLLHTASDHKRDSGGPWNVASYLYLMSQFCSRAPVNDVDLYCLSFSPSACM